MSEHPAAHTKRIARNPDGWSLEELLAATGARPASSGARPAPSGAATAGLRFFSVATDSRDVEPGSLFVALPGERADGHRYLADARDRGAAAALVSREEGPEGLPLVVAPDPGRALGRFAAWHRSRFPVRVAAVTGSVGKTSCKDMAAAVAAKAGPTWKSPGNLNSDVGLPLALLGITPRHGSAVLEMAMRGRGELALLCEWARPEIGILTRVAPAHLELLGSLEAIADAKFELVEALPRTGTAILNAGDPFQRERARRSPCPVVWYGLEEGDVRAEDVRPRGADGVRFTLRMPGGGAVVDLPIPGRHQVENALAAAALGRVLGLDAHDVAEALAGHEPTGMRCQIRRVGGVTILDDAYNSSPASLAAALAMLRDVAGGSHRLAVLGDMLELGPDGPDLHREAGRLCGDLDGLVTVGELGRLIGSAAVAAGLPPARWVHAQSIAAAALSLRSLVGPGDVVLVKASRGMHFEELVAELLLGWSG